MSILHGERKHKSGQEGGNESQNVARVLNLVSLSLGVPGGGGLNKVKSTGDSHRRKRRETRGQKKDKRRNEKQRTPPSVGGKVGVSGEKKEERQKG